MVTANEAALALPSERVSKANKSLRQHKLDGELREPDNLVLYIKRCIEKITTFLSIDLECFGFFEEKIKIEGTNTPQESVLALCGRSYLAFETWCRREQDQ